MRQIKNNQTNKKKRCVGGGGGEGNEAGRNRIIDDAIKMRK